MTLRIGVHPNNLHLTLAQKWTAAFADIDPVFVPYAEGRRSADKLEAGEIDVCGTGSTPPIMAQAAGLDVLYLAASVPRPANGAILVAPDAAIQNAAGLKGKRIALLDGSFHTYLLARALEAEGLSLRDVVRVELAPGRSATALAAGEVDAWVAMAPHLDQSLASGRTRVLLPCGSTIPNRSVFWTLRRRGIPPAERDGFVAGLVALGAEIAAHPDRAARYLAEEGAGAVDLAAWTKSVAAREWGIVPADTRIIAEQQAEADTLRRHGDLDHGVDLTSALAVAALDRADGCMIPAEALP